MEVLTERSNANMTVFHLNSVTVMEMYQYHHSYSLRSLSCGYLRMICFDFALNSPVCLCPARLGFLHTCGGFFSPTMLLRDLRVCRVMKHSLLFSFIEDKTNVYNSLGINGFVTSIFQ